MPKSDGGSGRAKATLASYERERDYWREREAQLVADQEAAREADDEQLAAGFDTGLAEVRGQLARAEGGVEQFRRMVERGWQPPHPESVEVLEHAEAIKRDNLTRARAHGFDPDYWQHSLDETRLRLRAAREAAPAGDLRRGDRRLASGRPSRRRTSRTGPRGDPDEPGELAPAARRRQPLASAIEIQRDLPHGWQAPLPENPTPREEADAWATDAVTVYEAAQRAEARRRAELIDWHRQRIAELEAPRGERR